MNPARWVAQLVRPLGLRRLFWRIFLAFWLSSLAIMLITTYVIVDSVESSQFVERVEARARLRAENLIQRWESSDDDYDLRADGINRRGRALSIFSPSGELIYGRPPGSTRHRGLKTLHIQGNQGTYKVQMLTPGSPFFLDQVVRRFQTLQFGLILIASALVSLLLSWRITKPLKMLGRFSRSCARGQLQLAIAPALLNRGDEVGDLAKDMQYMMHRIQVTLADQQRLMHDVSHELRAPLARLQAAAGLLEQKTGESIYVERMHQECIRMDRLIQQILDYSRMTRNNDPTQTYHLDVVIQEVIENLQLEFPECIVVGECPAEPVTMTGYASDIRTACENVLRNACKYAATDQPIQVKLEAFEQRAVVTIRDHGAGVEETEIDRLLQPFYRSGNQMHTSGFGLGLSIAEKAVEKHNGKLQLHNHPEGGLVVQIIIPRGIEPVIIGDAH